MKVKKNYNKYPLFDCEKLCLLISSHILFYLQKYLLIVII